MAPRRVLGEQFRGGAGILMAGTLVGLSIAFVASRLIASLLLGVEPNDRAASLGAGSAVLVIGLIASLIPALRATRINPAHII